MTQLVNRRKIIPYGCQKIDDDDIQAVTEVLKSEYLTTGPKVEEFESRFAEYLTVKEAVAVSSGTAALHSAMYAAGIDKGDEVIVPSMTFVATVNAIVYQGGIPVFCDIKGDNLLIDTNLIAEKITKKTKAIVAVDYAGHPCNYDQLRSLTEKYGLILISDACHALGAQFKNHKVGKLADITVFSFHPVKHITTGEGGMVTTDSKKISEKLRLFRNHGIDRDYREREKARLWQYDMIDLGYNYRISDIQCALGISQLKKLSGYIERRREIAQQYCDAFQKHALLEPLVVDCDAYHSYHLFVMKIKAGVTTSRNKIVSVLRNSGINVNVHYRPVHLHTFYRDRFEIREGLCPVCENEYHRIVSLPIYPKMSEDEIRTVIDEINKLN